MSHLPPYTIPIAEPSPVAILSTIHLQFRRIGVIDVVTAVITAEGDHMNTAIEETGRPQAAAEKPKAKKQARVGAQGAHVAPKKVKAPKKATAARKRLRPNQKEAGVARGGSKATKILELLKQADGATLAEIMKTTDWQAHSVRGFLSTAGKKHKLKIESTRTGGERTYKIAK